ncbi:hypothetical protein GCM10010109_86270 [Actinoplanes campanulatus]|nr:hypothetical protein GCM10010109_86270 [Actinoplanes campanulatus]GID41753.1 hypothetical protein Aca09nite_82590 [Actinoplanes campanulatus]
MVLAETAGEATGEVVRGAGLDAVTAGIAAPAGSAAPATCSGPSAQPAMTAALNTVTSRGNARIRGPPSQNDWVRTRCDADSPTPVRDSRKISSGTPAERPVVPVSNLSAPSAGAESDACPPMWAIR